MLPSIGILASCVCVHRDPVTYLPMTKSKHFPLTSEVWKSRFSPDLGDTELEKAAPFARSGCGHLSKEFTGFCSPVEETETALRGDDYVSPE